ncbi:MAG: amino acid ABC transporter permease [Rhodobacteraceae bacterium]|nr:amino acid ABC transporter permease [Paracoccaceae bacterium]
MSFQPYVRTDILPEQAPPSTASGPIAWMRENLFATIPNAILTIVAVYFIFSILHEVLPWVIKSSWAAGSLSECRDVIRETYGPDSTGACWAVIRERYLQLLFGFYPPFPGGEANGSVAVEGSMMAYFRVNLTFVFMLVAIAPLLFNSLPRKMIWFSALFPFLAFWLLWGGSIWPPLMVLAGIALGGVAYGVLSKAVSPLAGVIAALVTPVIWWLLLAGPVAGVLHGIAPIGILDVATDRFGGFMLSVIIGVTGIALSLPLGILLALGRQSDMMFIKAMCVGFIEFIRGVPLITLLFVASVLLNYFLPTGTTFDLVLRVVIMVTLFASAYMAEVVRGGLAALPTGQYEAADSLGLDYWKATRLITLPQALKISIPGIVSTFIGLFKDTTLVSIIGLMDPIGLTNVIRADTNWNGIVWELYGFIALVFFLFCFSMSRYSMYLERKLKTGH